MLCGATQILGLYVIASSEVLKKYVPSFETILKTLYLDRTTTAQATPNLILLTISLASGALTTQRYAFTPKVSFPTPEPMQFRVLSYKSNDLVTVRTTWKLDLLLPVKRSISGEKETRFHKTIIKVLTDEINKVQSAIIVGDNSQEIVQDDDLENEPSPASIVTKLGSGVLTLPDIQVALDVPSKVSTSSRKKGAKPAPSSPLPRNNEVLQFSMFSRRSSIYESNSLHVHQVASGALRLRGAIVGTVLVPPHEKQSGRFLRLDLIKSLQSRVGYLFDYIASQKAQSSDAEEEADCTSLGRAKSFNTQMPRRVILQTPVQQAFFCDYLLPHESLVECKERFKAILGLDGDFEAVALEEETIELPWTIDELSDMPTDSVTSHKSSSHNDTRHATVAPSSQLIWRLLLLAMIGAALAFGAVLFSAQPPSAGS